MADGIAVFFDIGDTLAAPRVIDGRFVGLTVFPFVPEVLTRLRASRPAVPPVLLGLMSNTGNETAATLQRILTDSGLAALVDAELCLFSSVERIDKSDPDFFVRGRQRAGLPAPRCLFVGENAAERTVAASVGFLVSPHPLHAVHLVEATLTAPQP